MYTVKSTIPVSYKFIDSQGNLRDKVVINDSKLKNTYFDGSSVGFCHAHDSDLVLVPDEKSIHRDPIRNMSSVFCFIQRPNGKRLDYDFRTQAERAMTQQVNGALFGVEPEFFVCGRDIINGNKLMPIDLDSSIELQNEKQYKWYGCLPPLDNFQSLRDEIAKYLETAGLHVEAIHHEAAPGQCEFSWRCNDLLTTADQMLLFKYIVVATCASRDLVADFRAKPFDGINGNGCHVHQSLPIMRSFGQFGETKDGNKFVEAYAQGLVDHYDELLEVCCVGRTSKSRLVPGFEAPTKENNGWGWHDRTKTVRIPAGGERVEYRLPDPEMNPYVTLPKMLKFGYEAIKRELNEKGI